MEAFTEGDKARGAGANSPLAPEVYYVAWPGVVCIIYGKWQKYLKGLRENG